MPATTTNNDSSSMTPLLVAGAIGIATVVAVQALTPAPAKVLKVPPTFNEDEKNWSPYEAGKSGPQHSISAEGTVRYAAKGHASKAETPGRTMPEILRLAAKKFGDKPAMRLEADLPPLSKDLTAIPPSKPVEQWKTWTYNQYLAEVETAAKAFIKLGMKRFDSVTIFGFNHPCWYMAELAAMVGGGVAAGIYPTDTPDQVQFKANHSGASIAVVEDMQKAKAFLDNAKSLPKLKAIVVWGEEVKETSEKNIVVCSWSSLAAKAKDVADSVLEERIASQRPGHCCCLIYTSGTTGNPKAVMISHDNILFESSSVFKLVETLAVGGEERVLSYLPLSHVAGMMVDIICPLVVSASTSSYVCSHFARNYDLKVGTIGDRLRAVRPTLFLGVPRVWEKIAEKMKAMVAAAPPTGAKLHIAKWAKGKGLAHQINCQLGGNGVKGFGYNFAKKKVLDLVRQRLGLDACKFAFTGAAPISIETLEYFGALGININEVYGMSECTGATTWSIDEAHVWGSCGWAMPGAEVKILNSDLKECPRATNLSSPEEESQGEICYRGRHIMLGYMANPDLGKDHVEEIKKKNAEAVTSDGWLRSGDKGCMDTRGMVKITGRYKELIIGAGGENIAPVPMEDNVKKLHQGVSNIMMVGDKQKFNVALVTLKAKGATGVTPGGDELDGAALNIKPGVTTISAAMSDKDWIESIKNAIIATNKNGAVCPSNAAAIQKFMILPRDFSVDTDEFTPTYKLKRSVVEKKYAKQIKMLYADENTKADYVQYKA